MQVRNPVFVAIAAVLLQVSSAGTISGAVKDGDSEMERIIGGQDAKEGQFPWVAALYSNDRFICTASIIGESTVLTAAHCVVNNGVTGPAGSFHAIANLNRSAETVRIEFASVTPHPQYEQSSFKNDIAVFKTTDTIALSDTVKPICIARRDTAPRNYENVTAMGWGNTRRTRFILPNYPEVLKYVEQKVVGTFLCRASYYFLPLEEYKICAGSLLEGICNGDSGGPLIYYDESDDKNAVQIGVASYGNAITGCGFVTPSVWTRPSYFSDFIKEVAAGDPALCEI